MLYDKTNNLFYVHEMREDGICICQAAQQIARVEEIPLDIVRHLAANYHRE